MNIVDCTCYLDFHLKKHSTYLRLGGQQLNERVEITAVQRELIFPLKLKQGAGEEGERQHLGLITYADLSLRGGVHGVEHVWFHRFPIQPNHV